MAAHRLALLVVWEGCVTMGGVLFYDTIATQRLRL